MKLYKQFLVAFSLAALSVPGTAVAQDATPTPKANTMTDTQKKVAAQQAQKNLDDLEKNNWSWVCAEYVDINKMVIEKPEITQHKDFSAAFLLAAQICSAQITELSKPIEKRKKEPSPFHATALQKQNKTLTYKNF